MIPILNIIGFIFMGLMAYFLWAIDGWLWVKAAVSFFVGFTFIAYAQAQNKETTAKTDNSKPHIHYYDSVKENSNE